MVTVTVATGCGSGAAANFPSTPACEVCPSPVAYTVSTEPAAAGAAVPLGVPSWFSAAACPRPDPSAVNTPGAVAAAATTTGADAAPALCTTTCTGPPPTAYGATAPTCNGVA